MNAVAVPFKDQPQEALPVTISKTLPRVVKQHQLKRKSVVSINKISAGKNTRSSEPLKLQPLDESWESIDSKSSITSGGEVAFFGYDSDEEAQVPPDLNPISDWGTSLHMALMVQEITSNESDERAMLAVAQYVRDQAAHGNFEFTDEVICNGLIYDRGYLLDILNAYDPEVHEDDYESCNDTSSSGRE